MDISGIVGLYSSLSDESMHLRFFCAMSPAAMESAAALDPERDYDFGLVVADDHRARASAAC